jgi:hypothetical protein
MESCDSARAAVVHGHRAVAERPRREQLELACAGQPALIQRRALRVARSSKACRVLSAEPNASNRACARSRASPARHPRPGRVPNSRPMKRAGRCRDPDSRPVGPLLALRTTVQTVGVVRREGFDERGPMSQRSCIEETRSHAPRSRGCRTLVYPSSGKASRTARALLQDRL